jgi:transcriptional regulator with XRE-family HTH domain
VKKIDVYFQRHYNMIMDIQYDKDKAAKLIRAWQSDAKMRGGDVADKVGISHAYYSDIRNAHVNGSIKVLTKIADVLGHSLNELIGIEAAKTARLDEAIKVIDKKRVEIDTLSFIRGLLDEEQFENLRELTDKDSQGLRQWLLSFIELSPDYKRVVEILIFELLQAQSPKKKQDLIKEERSIYDSYTRDKLDEWFMVDKFIDTTYGDKSHEGVRRLDRKEEAQKG